MIKINFERSLVTVNHNKTVSLLKKRYDSKIHDINAMINLKSGLGNDFLGWTDWPNKNHKDLLDDITITAKQMIESKQIDTLVVIGIGGSYLGARSAIEMINGFFPGKKQPVEVIFAGHTMSSTYTKQLLEELSHRNYAVNVISKSGTTLEPSLAFRLIRDHMTSKYGEQETASRIIATTDAKKGILKELATNKGYKTFIIPDDIGGRFSVTTAVGLVPMAFAGVDIYRVMEGAKLASAETDKADLNHNSALQYACFRNYMFTKENKVVEVLGTYELQMQMMLEWWKQLFGESEGKEGMALFPASVVLSTDLHSMGQYLQDGNKIFFETMIKVIQPNKNIEITPKDYNDKLQFIEGKTLHDINYVAMRGTVNAHANDGKTPNVVLEMEGMDAFNYGYFVQWMFKACAYSAYLLKLNPFNQPGVEIYKEKMFTLLGKGK